MGVGSGGTDAAAGGPDLPLLDDKAPNWQGMVSKAVAAATESAHG